MLAVWSQIFVVEASQFIDEISQYIQQDRQKDSLFAILKINWTKATSSLLLMFMSL